MKRLILTLLLAAALFVSLAGTAFAGGDMHHGDKGQGEVIQHQIRLAP